MKKTIKLRNYRWEEYNLPQPPNFVRRVHDDFPVPVGELSDVQLNKLAAEWKKRLLARAAEQRKNLSDYL